MSIRHVLAMLVVLLAGGTAGAFDVVLNAQGEYLDAYLIDGTEPPRRVVLIDPDPADPTKLKGKPPRGGRHVNGQLCFFPKGFGHDGDFLLADDTYREACLDPDTPQARCRVRNKRSKWYVGKDPDGWAVFHKNGKWTREHIHTAWDFSQPEPQGNFDPQGCAFDAQGRFFGTDVGHGDPTSRDGSLIVFFPGKKNRYDTYCFLDKQLGAPGMPVQDAAGNLYIAEPAGGRVVKFAPPFPSSAADCQNPEKLVSTPPTKTTFIAGSANLATPAGLAHVTGSDHLYVGSVLIPAVVNEYDANGALVRNIVMPGVPANPLGLGAGSDGTLYYAELNLDPMTFSPRCGRVSRTRFAAGGILAPEVLGTRLRFPDGVTVVDSSRFAVDWKKLAPSPTIDPSRCGGE